jgi:hypothetical protein
MVEGTSSGAEFVRRTSSEADRSAWLTVQSAVDTHPTRGILKLLVRRESLLSPATALEQEEAQAALEAQRRSRRGTLPVLRALRAMICSFEGATQIASNEEDNV